MSQNLVPVGSLPKTSRLDDAIKEVINGLVQKAQPTDLVDTDSHFMADAFRQAARV